MVELSVVSQLPCVIKDRLTGAYAPKGWMWFRHHKSWVFDVKKAKVYRNSAGAKNAMRGASGIVAIVLEFHKELDKKCPCV